MGLSFIGGDTWETYQTGMILVYFIMHHVTYKVRVMMFNSTFNNISDISWQSVLLLLCRGRCHIPSNEHKHEG
jgi:hypothetical protein